MKKHTNFPEEVEVSETKEESVWVWATAIFGLLFIGWIIVKLFV